MVVPLLACSRSYWIRNPSLLSLCAGVARLRVPKLPLTTQNMHVMSG